MPVKFSREVLKGSTKNTAGDFNQQSRFSVEIEGVTIGGGQKVGTLVLERDWSSSTEFYDWFKTVYEGNVQRKSISIVYMTDDGGESTRVNLHECWPKKWKLSGLNSRTSGHVSETLEIMY